MNWWLTQHSRALAEQNGLASLADNTSWLSNMDWGIDTNLHLMVEFDISYAGETIPMKMSYPKFFPDIPPQIFPQDKKRLSGHQYGAGGELCLEYRPDNWEAYITGAMMVESAYRLLSGENPSAGMTSIVESAHKSSIGQDIRLHKFRAIFLPEFVSAVNALEDSQIYPFLLKELFHAQHWIVIPKRIGAEENPIWLAEPTVNAFFEHKGYILCVAESMGKINNFENLLRITERIPDADLKSLVESSQKELFFVVRQNGVLTLISLPSGTGKRDIREYKIVNTPIIQQRLPDGYLSLAEKKIAIIGCGSIGSKIAVSLARNGVSNFVLIDGDIFNPGNIVRNDLDQRAIGLNKPDALENRILEINPSANIETRRMHLGGQESSTLTDLALNQISGSDLIIEATATAEVFNLMSSMAKRNKIPLIWGYVYEGGIGGLVARSRPDLDPPPLVARRQIKHWCEEQNSTWKNNDFDSYDFSSDDAPPMIADDADVAIISSHMTRYAIDILVRENSIFPYSAYLIGLQNEWIFAAPFDTCPIQLVHDTNSGWEEVEEQEADVAEFISKMFSTSKD